MIDPAIIRSIVAMLILVLASLLSFSDEDLVEASPAVHYSVFEEQNVGTRIGNVLTDSKRGTDFPGGNNCQLFDMSNRPKITEIIKVNSSTCELLVNDRIDREALCQGVKCVLQLSVFMATQIWVTVTIEILDINDHAPVFEPAYVTLSIPENSPIGYIRDLPLAIDPDHGQNSVQSYVLHPLIAHFDLEYHSFSSLQLRVILELDHEKRSMRNFTTKVIACDWGTPRLCGNLNVFIMVTDLNDNIPKFQNSNLTVEIMEDSKIGKVVTTVVAQDHDDGDNGLVAYSILPSATNKQALEFFLVNSTTGQVYLQRSLQSQDPLDVFKLTVTASDRGLIPLSSDCTVNILVVDVNNHDPLIVVTPTLGTVLQISEGMPSETTVGLVKVTDKDKGDNGLVSCKLSNRKSKTSLEEWNIGYTGQTYKLLVTEQLDREEVAALNISIICRDRGLPPRSTEVQLSILVTDVNEFDPVLKVEPNQVVIPENLAVNSTIARLYTTDKDADAKFILKLVTNKDIFWIDESGFVRLSQSIDRESRSVIMLSAIVIDQGYPRSRTTSLTFSIKISDVNDNEPQLLDPRSFQLLENSIVSPSRIGQLKAFDSDLGQNGTVLFTILRATSIDNNYLNNTFYIDENNGSLFSLKPIDRETTPAIVLRILLKDGGSPSLSREEVVHLTVVDENDNHPMWQFPSPENCHINMSALADFSRYEHRPILITVVRATDLDSPPNSNISFKLLSATCNNVQTPSFSLDPFTGHLVCFGPLPEGLYTIQMQASDNGKPALLSEVASLYLKVFSPKNYFFNSENDRLSLTLILALGSVTSIICVSLVIAIIVVRRNRHGPLQFSSGGHNNDQNSVVNESLAKWTEEQNQYLDSWGYQSQYCSYPIITPHYKMSSIGEPLLPPPGPNDILNTMARQPHMCSMMHLRRPPHQDIDVSSADSGRGPSEEENFHSDGKCKDNNRSRGIVYATLPEGTAQCVCETSMGLCNSCMSNLATQCQYNSYSPSPTNNTLEPLFCNTKHSLRHSPNNYNTIDTIVSAGAAGPHIEVLSANPLTSNHYLNDVSSFCNHTNV